MHMAFFIRLTRLAFEDLEKVPAHDRGRIMDAIEDNLSHQPLTPSRHRKPLIGLEPPWDQLRPVWQLTVEPYRIFYDADPDDRHVMIQAVRAKGRKTTEEIL